MRFFLILSIFLLIGCGKKELPTSIPTRLASDNAISHFSDGISIGNDQNNIEIRVISSDGIGMNLLNFYGYNSVLAILGSDDRSGFLRICDGSCCQS